MHAYSEQRLAKSFDFCGIKRSLVVFFLGLCPSFRFFRDVSIVAVVMCLDSGKETSVFAVFRAYPSVGCKLHYYAKYNCKRKLYSCNINNSLIKSAMVGLIPCSHLIVRVEQCRKRRMEADKKIEKPGKDRRDIVL